MPSHVKELLMREIEKEFENNPYVFLSSFEGLSVADFHDFRKALERVSKRSLVIKHSMVKKVFAQRKVTQAEKLLGGQLLVTFGVAEPQAISKAIMDYAKAHDKKFVPSGVILENQVFEKEFLKQLASLPSRKELLTQVAVRVKSPISGLVLTLSQLVRGLVVAISEIKKQKELQPA